ncbi:MAG TPA: dihydrolipoamide acetyltransferase family protein, partial [Gemmatimonadales bacterium]|nr:dihydrolipoamide acetyltransferase family protein [Gemmatimonadales bacterium]
MATNVVMEALSPTMEEGRLVEWKKQEGEAVAVGDVIAEVETDKAVMELVARTSGTLLKHLVAAGATVPVSDPVAVIGEAGEAANGAAPAQKAPAREGETGATAPASAPPQAAAPKAAEPRAEPKAAEAPAPAAPTPPADSGRVKASPLARKVAAERGLDLRSVRGSGPAGRIIRRDLEGVEAAPAPAAGGAPGAAAPRPFQPAAGGAPHEDVPLTQIRKTIARRLAQSLGPVPTFYLTSEIDMERVAEAREALNALGEGKVSFNDITIKAVALALRQHRACNAWWQDDHIRYWNEVHVGMAVAIDEGLITPVIRHADQKSLRQIAAESKELAERARARRLTPEEYTGATFSVSNLGMLDIDEFTAIINPPEAGILAIGRMAERAVVEGGAVTVRKR